MPFGCLEYVNKVKTVVMLLGIILFGIKTIL